MWLYKHIMLHIQHKNVFPVQQLGALNFIIFFNETFPITKHLELFPQPSMMHLQHEEDGMNVQY